MFVARHVRCNQRQVAVRSEPLQNTALLKALCLHNSGNSEDMDVRVLVSVVANKSLDGCCGVDDGVH